MSAAAAPPHLWDAPAPTTAPLSAHGLLRCLHLQSQHASHRNRLSALTMPMRYQGRAAREVATSKLWFQHPCPTFHLRLAGVTD